jgi:hypothetical protein
MGKNNIASFGSSHHISVASSIELPVLVEEEEEEEVSSSSVFIINKALCCWCLRSLASTICRNGERTNIRRQTSGWSSASSYFRKNFFFKFAGF